MRLTLSIGTRVQYTQPPKGSLNGMPSTSTSVRLTPLGPMPRSETPCAVGCDDRLLLRRKRLKVGTSRSTSSATTAGDCRIVSFSMMFALTGTSPSRFAVRVGVTVTVSNSPATASTTSTSRLAGTDWDHSAKPPARTISVRSPAGAIAIVNRPSRPDIVCCSGPLVPVTITDAPDTDRTGIVPDDARDGGLGRLRAWRFGARGRGSRRQCQRESKKQRLCA